MKGNYFGLYYVEEQIFLLHVRHLDCSAQQKADAGTETFSSSSQHQKCFQATPRMETLLDLLPPAEKSCDIPSPSSTMSKAVRQLLSVQQLQ